MVVGTDEHFIGAEGIGAIAAFDHVKRIDDIALAFAHFLAIRSIDVAIIEKFFDGLAEGQVALVGEEFAPKANVEQVRNSVIATNVNISWGPIFNGFGIPSSFSIARRDVAPEVPA